MESPPLSPATTVEDQVTLWIERISVQEVDPREEAARLVQQAPSNLRDALKTELDGFLQLSQGLPALGVQTGQRIGSYELLEYLGSGATGQVWRTRGTEGNLDGQELALKVIHGHYHMAAEGAERLSIEVTAASRVQHPSVVPILASEQVEQQQLLIMPLVGDGTTLADELLLARERTRTEDISRTLARLKLVCEGLAELHAQQVLHLDLKPSNLLVAADGQLRITDLGLARLLDDPGLTRTLQLLGTPAYMAPELARGERSKATARADVWALGVILFEVLSLSRPFQGATSAQVLTAILREEPALLPRVIPGLDSKAIAACAEVISCCLEKNPAQRYAHGGEVAAELTRLLAGERIQGRPRTRRLLGWARRRRRGLAVSALAATAISLTLGVAWREGQLTDKAQRSLALTTRLVSSAQSKNTSISTFELNALADDLRTLTRDAGLGSARERAATLTAVGTLFSEHGDRRELGVSLLKEALLILPLDARAEAAQVHIAIATAMGDSGASMPQLEHLKQVIALLEDNPDPALALMRARAVVEGRMTIGRIEKHDPVSAFGDPNALRLVHASLPENPDEDTVDERRDRFMLARADDEWIGDVEQYLTFTKDCVALFEAKLGDNHLWTIDALAVLGFRQYLAGQHEESYASFSEANLRARRELGESHPITLRLCLGMAQEQLHRGNVEQAVIEYRTGLDGLKALWGGHNALTLRISIGLGSALLGLGRHGEVQALVAEILPLIDSQIGTSSGPAVLVRRLAIQSGTATHDFDLVWKAMCDQWASFSAELLGMRYVTHHDLNYSVSLSRTFAVQPEVFDRVRSWIHEVRASFDVQPLTKNHELGLDTEIDRLEGLLDRFQRAYEGDPAALLHLLPEPGQRDMSDWILLMRAQRIAGDLTAAHATLNAIDAIDAKDPDWLALERALLEQAEGSPAGLKALQETGTGWVALRARELLGG